MIDGVYKITHTHQKNSKIKVDEFSFFDLGNPSIKVYLKIGLDLEKFELLISSFHDPEKF